MSEPGTIHVNNIAPATTESDLTSFFSFCGKITSLSLTPSGDVNAPKSATITFERQSAAKTAVLLDGTPLQGFPLDVQSAHTIDEIAGADHTANTGAIGPDGEIPQEQKPRTAIFAEYLAHGYIIADTTLQKAIEVDKQQGITAKFTNLLTNVLNTVDSKVHVAEKAKAADQQYHLTEKADAARGTLARYFEKAAETALGQRIRSFYSESEKQVLEIHEEAKRIAALKQEKSADQETFGKTADGKPFVGTRTEGVQDATAKAAPTGQFEHATHDIKETTKDVTGTY